MYATRQPNDLHCLTNWVLRFSLPTAIRRGIDLLWTLRDPALPQSVRPSRIKVTQETLKRTHRARPPRISYTREKHFKEIRRDGGGGGRRSTLGQSYWPQRLKSARAMNMCREMVRGVQCRAPKFDHYRSERRNRVNNDCAREGIPRRAQFENMTCFLEMVHLDESPQNGTPF